MQRSRLSGRSVALFLSPPAQDAFLRPFLASKALRKKFRLPLPPSVCLLALLLPLQEDDYYVTLVLSAKDSSKGASNYTELVEWGQEEIVVFQTDTTQPDNAARVLAGLSLMTITWVMLFNTLFASFGATGAQQHEAFVPTLGW